MSASALWLGVALLAAIMSIRVAMSVALVEITVGAIAGNTIGLQLTPRIPFLAGFAAILLTFLAGTEIDSRRDPEARWQRSGRLSGSAWRRSTYRPGSARRMRQHERLPETVKREWIETLELMNGLHAGVEGLFGAWFEQLRLTLIGLAWVALGSALGGAARFFISGLVGLRVGETFPWGTMAVNVTGAFLIGIIAATVIHQVLFHEPGPWQFAVVGILGSYTTVSSLSLQTLALARDGEHARAGGNLLLSLALGLAAVALGFVVGSAATGWGAL